jgi:hypothetical protein
VLLDLIEEEGFALTRKSSRPTSFCRSFCPFVGMSCGVMTLTRTTIRVCVKNAPYEPRPTSRLLEKPTEYKGSAMGPWVLRRLRRGACYTYSLVVRSASAVGWFVVRLPCAHQFAFKRRMDLLFLARGDD